MRTSWRKSSYSSGMPNCVEVGCEHDVTGWRKPERSNPNGACAEVGTMPGAVVVRDTKNRRGPVLRYAPAVWREFTTKVKGSS
jgi:hypothetical protein